MGIAPKQKFIFAIDSAIGAMGEIDMPRLDPVLALVLDQIDPDENWPIYSGRYKKRLKAQWEPAAISDNTLRGAPQPKNDVYNCGVYIVAYAFCLAFGFDMMCFKQGNLDEGKRGRMFAELCHGSLGEPPFDYDWFDLPEGADNDRELLIKLGYIKESAPAEEKPDEEPDETDEGEESEPPESPESAPRDDDDNDSDYDYESGSDDDEDGYSPPRRSGRGASRRSPAAGTRRSSRIRGTRTRNVDQGESVDPDEDGPPTTPKSSQPGLPTPDNSSQKRRKPEKQRRRRPFEKISDEHLESLDPLTRGRVVDMQLRTGNPALTLKQIESGLRAGWPMQFPPAMFQRRGFIYKPSKKTKEFFRGLSEERLVEICSDVQVHPQFEGWEEWQKRGVEILRKWMMNQHEAMKRLEKRKDTFRALKPVKGLLPDSLLKEAGWDIDKDSDDDGIEGSGKGKEGGSRANVPASGQPAGSDRLLWPQTGEKRSRTPDEDDYGAAPKRSRR